MSEQPNVKVGETYWVRDESGNEELPALCERGVHGYRIWVMGHDEQYETLGEWTAIERIPTAAELAEMRAELERLRGQVERVRSLCRERHIMDRYDVLEALGDPNA